MMEFRKINKAEDIYRILIKFEEYFPHLREKVFDLHVYSNKLFQYSEFYVAYIGTEPAGMVCFYANDTTSCVGYISLICVHENYRKSGLGRRLIEYALVVMKQKGMKTVRLEVDFDNTIAQGFYGHIGFKQVENKKSSCYLQMDI